MPYKDPERQREAQRRYAAGPKGRACAARSTASGTRRDFSDRAVADGRNARWRQRARDRKLAWDLALFEDTPEKRHSVTTTKKLVVLSDIQMPFEDSSALSQALEVIGVVQPDTVVLNGDIVDCYLESTFLKDAKRAERVVPEQHRRARELMARLADIPTKVWLGGNHEARWERLFKSMDGVPRKSPIVENLIAGRAGDIDLSDPVDAFAKLYDMAEYGFTYYPYPHRLYLAEGNLVVTHGKYVSRHSGQSAKRTFEWLGRSCIIGHTHRMGTYYVSMDGRERGAWENGCLCVLEPEYDDAPNWQQGFSVVGINGPDFHVVQVPIIRRNGQPIALYSGLDMKGV